MPIRIGPFAFIYTAREQKIRDLIKHLVAKHGIVKARLIVNEEYIKAADANIMEQMVYWNDVRWEIKHLTHLSGWAAEKGL